MAEPKPNANWLIDTHPTAFPGLTVFWDFARRESDGTWPAAAGESRYVLRERAGETRVVEDAQAPFAGRAMQLEEGQWLNIPRADCPSLDVHGRDGVFTLVAWFRRGPKQNGGCEFIAGQWNETNLGRQYGLFLNIGTWRGGNQVCGHLSTTGGPTPGYKYCCDGPMGLTQIGQSAWYCVALTYDGVSGSIFLDGLLDAHPPINPYSLHGGLHDGGPSGSDFTVGGVDRSGEIGNFFAGRIGGLAFYRRVLSPAEIWALAQAGRTA